MILKKNSNEALFFILCFLLPFWFLVDPVKYAFILIIVKGYIFMLCGYSLYMAVQFFRYARIIEDTPTSKIRSCAQGVAEIEGRQYNLPDQKNVGPLSNKSCTWYKYTVEEYKYAGGNTKDKTWVLIEEDVSTTPFIINDGTGECIVDPTDATVQTSSHISCYGFSNVPKYDPQESIIFKGPRSLLGRYKFTEYYMLPETYIYALGMFSTREQKNYLSGQGLPKDMEFLLSAKRQNILIRNYKLRSICYIGIFCLLVKLYPFIISEWIKPRTIQSGMEIRYDFSSLPASTFDQSYATT